MSPKFNSTITLGNVISWIPLLIALIAYFVLADDRSIDNEVDLAKFKKDDYSVFKVAIQEDVKEHDNRIISNTSKVASFSSFMDDSKIRSDDHNGRISSLETRTSVQETQVDNIYKYLEDIKGMINTNNTLLTEALKSKR